MFAFGCSFEGLFRPEYFYDVQCADTLHVHLSFHSSLKPQPSRVGQTSCLLTNGNGLLISHEDGRHLQIWSNEVTPANLIYPDLLKAVQMATESQSDALLHGVAFSYLGHTCLSLGDRNVGKSSVLARMTSDSRFRVISDDLVRIVDSRVILGSPFICIRDPIRLSRSPDATHFSRIRIVFLLRRGNPRKSRVLESRNLEFEIRRASIAPLKHTNGFSGASFAAIFGNDPKDAFSSIQRFLCMFDA